MGSGTDRGMRKRKTAIYRRGVGWEMIGKAVTNSNGAAC